MCSLRDVCVSLQNGWLLPRFKPNPLGTACHSLFHSVLICTCLSLLLPSMPLFHKLLCAVIVFHSLWSGLFFVFQFDFHFQLPLIFFWRGTSAHLLGPPTFQKILLLQWMKHEFCLIVCPRCKEKHSFALQNNCCRLTKMFGKVHLLSWQIISYVVFRHILSSFGSTHTDTCNFFVCFISNSFKIQCVILWPSLFWSFLTGYSVIVYSFVDLSSLDYIWTHKTRAA